MKYVIVGASAGLGRALSHRLAAEGHDLVLVSSDERDVVAVAADLEIRHGVRVVPLAADLGADVDHIDRVAAAAAGLGGIDGLLFPIGAASRHDDVDLDPRSAERLTRVNFLSIASVVARFLPALRTRPRAVIVGFGSVAAARGRGANVIYSAAKRALRSYFESLRHALAGSNVIVQFYVLGYLDTDIATGSRTLLPKADPDAVAARVVRDLGREIGVIYSPGFWRYISAVIAWLPWIVFRRIRF